MARLEKLLVIALFAFSACSPKLGVPIETNATGTPNADGAETAQSATEDSTPAVLPTAEVLPLQQSPTPLASLTLTTTPTAAGMPSGFSPVLLGQKYDADTFFMLLGGVQGENWLTAEQAAAQIAGSSQYDVYTLAKGMHQVYGYAPVKSHPYPDYFVSTDATLDETGMIGVVHGWPARQGDAEEIDSTNEIYR